MSKLYVTEFVGADEKANTVTPAARVAGATDQPPLTISGTSAQSAAFGTGGSLVRLHTDVICCVAFGTNPTATTSSMRMAADSTEYFAVPAGSAWKVAVIAGT